PLFPYTTLFRSPQTSERGRDRRRLQTDGRNGVEFHGIGHDALPNGYYRMRARGVLPLTRDGSRAINGLGRQPWAAGRANPSRGHAETAATAGQDHSGQAFAAPATLGWSIRMALPKGSRTPMSVP